MDFSLFAAGPDRLQLYGRDLPASPVTLSVGAQQHRLDGTQPSAIINVDELETPPGAVPQWQVGVEGGPASHPMMVTTLSPPPGRHLARVATASDLHVGAYRWGYLSTMRPAGPPTEELGGAGYATTAAFDALVDIDHWSPDLVVLKGDCVQHRNQHDFTQLGELVDRFEQLPMTMVPGNHDVDCDTDIALPESVGRRNLPFVTGIKVDDVPGLRVISVNTAIEGSSRGTLVGHHADILDAAADAARSGTGTIICLHHQLQLQRIPRGWPPGISSAESLRFLDDLVAANPSSLVTAGHVHRNRHHRYGPITITEVASTRDWPGVWAAYDVYEGGITQAVYRISAPRTVQWHDYSRSAVGGLWALWSPGRFGDRCITVRW